ncbi:Phosphate acetyltransferase [Cedecea neteri]|uniref:Phosphate acetyltransferase n=1 Tax=Cedecea neteri TaxID=158822 RepID=A0A2X3IF36_9ENTR|nr:Phosphate acetyltransferase [Cedecea neteri]
MKSPVFAAAQGVELGAGIEIVDPEVVRESYVARLVELRKSKGMTEAVAREQLEDNVVLGTLMLEQDEVDAWFPAQFTPPPTPSVHRCS